MAREPKAASLEKPAKRKMTPEEQSELFIKTARELGVDETGEEFERAFAKITPATQSGERDRPNVNPPPSKRSKRPV